MRDIPCSSGSCCRQPAPSVRSWMHNRLSRQCGVAVLLMIVVMAGCGYRRPQRIPTTGTVRLDGKEVAGASLVFIPTGGGRMAMATSDEQGFFAVSSFGGNDGLPPGTYRVLVARQALTAKAARRAERLGEKGAVGDDGKATAVEFEEQDYENLLPPQYADPEVTPLVLDISSGGSHLEILLQAAGD